MSMSNDDMVRKYTSICQQSSVITTTKLIHFEQTNGQHCLQKKEWKKCI